MSSRCPDARLLLGLVLAIAFAGCGRDTQTVDREAPPRGERPTGVRTTPLRPGVPVTTGAPRENPYGRDPRVVKEGHRLYQWMNCVGCHFEGGGGMGPPLIDADWIYGRDPAQIFASIAEGRPNGMPAFGDKLAADEIWRIVAYVETLAEQGAEQSDDEEGGGRTTSGRGGGDGR